MELDQTVRPEHHKIRMVITALSEPQSDRIEPVGYTMYPEALWDSRRALYASSVRFIVPAGSLPLAMRALPPRAENCPATVIS